MKRFFLLLSLTVFIMGLPMPNTALSTQVTLVNNRVISDYYPFYSIGDNDLLGSGNYAMSSSDWITIPYAIFNFGSTNSVSNAILTWNFGELMWGSGPANIALYAGNDADGTISTSDRFMGALVDTSTYSGGETKNFNITDVVNASLLTGPYFAVRLEAVISPDELEIWEFYGGQFLTPSLEINTSAVPEPTTVLLLGLGLVGLTGARKKFKK